MKTLALEILSDLIYVGTCGGLCICLLGISGLCSPVWSVITQSLGYLYGVFGSMVLLYDLTTMVKKALELRSLINTIKQKVDQIQEDVKIIRKDTSAVIIIYKKLQLEKEKEVRVKDLKAIDDLLTDMLKQLNELMNIVNK